MAYVTGFAHDVFVSYSSIDNDVLVSDGREERGWVEMVLDKLRVNLNARLGCRDCDIFIDTEFVRSNLPITPQILDAVRASAILLVVLSPAYLKSHWCDRERHTFLGCVQERLEGGGGHGGAGASGQPRRAAGGVS